MYIYTAIESHRPIYNVGAITLKQHVTTYVVTCQYIHTVLLSTTYLPSTYKYVMIC